MAKFPSEIIGAILAWEPIEPCVARGHRSAAPVCRLWRDLLRRRHVRRRCVPWRSPFVYPNVCCKTHEEDAFVAAIQDIHENASVAVRSMHRICSPIKNIDSFFFIHISESTFTQLGRSWSSRLFISGINVEESCCGGKGVRLSHRCSDRLDRPGRRRRRKPGGVFYAWDPEPMDADSGLDSDLDTNLDTDLNSMALTPAVTQAVTQGPIPEPP